MATTTAPTTVRLLDVEPDIGARLRDDDRAEARERLRLRTTLIPEGVWSLAGVDQRLHPTGLVVVDGVLLREVRLGGRSALQLLGRGDVVLPRTPGAETLDAQMQLVAATETCVAILDDRLQKPFALWPGLALGLLDRVGQQLARLAMQTAICQLPRVEDRLEATFWDLADRWGRVTPNGVYIPLRLTHEVLARLVGGRRPTISLALAALAERGIVMREPDGSWLMVATAPTLTANAPATATPLVTRAESAERREHYEPWVPAVREELLTAARRAAIEHAQAAERVEADRRRYEATRLRSRQLREQAARQREARAERGPAFSPRRPGAPSGG